MSADEFKASREQEISDYLDEAKSSRASSSSLDKALWIALLAGSGTASISILNILASGKLTNEMKEVLLRSEWFFVSAMFVAYFLGMIISRREVLYASLCEKQAEWLSLVVKNSADVNMLKEMSLESKSEKLKITDLRRLSIDDCENQIKVLKKPYSFFNIIIPILFLLIFALFITGVGYPLVSITF